MEKFYDTIQDKYGTAIIGASVAIYDHGTVDLATLYDDDETTPIDNPLISDTAGFVEAMLPNGKYDITTTYRGQSRTIVGVVANDGTSSGDASAFEVGEVATVVTCNTQIPPDDTIPQNSEGTEVVTVTITPNSASSDIEIEYLVPGSVAATMSIIAAVFKDADASALSGSVGMEVATGANQRFQIAGKFKVAAGDTSARTYKLRVGPSNASTAYVNGDGSGTRLFGGVLKAIITAREI